MSKYNITRTASGYPLYALSALKVEQVSKSNAEKEADRLAWEVYQIQLKGNNDD